MDILFAFSVGENGTFEDTYFGDADKFIIYKYTGSKLQKKDEVINRFKTPGSIEGRFSKEKTAAILSLLEGKGVRILVSKKFGKNLKMANRHFIPVIVNEDNPEEVKNILLEKINWLTDELKNRHTGYMLFRIKNGVLKTDVRQHSA